METDRVLAKRPPTGSLVAFVLYAGLATGLGAIARWFVDNRDRMFAAKEGGLIYIRLGFVTIAALGATLATFACLRIAMRWTVRTSSISLAGDRLVLRLPARRPWWMPLQPPSIEVAIATADIRSLRILPFAPAVLEIEAERAVQVPSKLFATGVYSLDAALREAIGSSAWPHPMAKVEPLARWTTSNSVRIGMVIVGGCLLVGGMVVTGVLAAAGGGKVGLLPFLLGLGLLMAVGFYRGQIVLDARGVFYERGGTTSYLAWSEIDPKWIAHKSNFLGAWQELSVQTAKASTVPQRISLNRILGLGFPLRQIGDEIEALARKYR